MAKLTDIQIDELRQLQKQTVEENPELKMIFLTILTLQMIDLGVKIMMLGSMQHIYKTLTTTLTINMFHC